MHITEISFKFLLALHATVFDATDFVGVETLPSLVVKTFEEVDDKDAINEVYKSISHVALILKIDGQVKEIILAFLFPIKGL